MGFVSNIRRNMLFYSILQSLGSASYVARITLARKFIYNGTFLCGRNALFCCVVVVVVVVVVVSVFKSIRFRCSHCVFGFSKASVFKSHRFQSAFPKVSVFKVEQRERKAQTDTFLSVFI